MLSRIKSAAVQVSSSGLVAQTVHDMRGESPEAVIVVADPGKGIAEPRLEVTCGADL